MNLPALVISGLPFGSPGTKSHLDATPADWCKIYYMGEVAGFPRVRAVVSFVSPKLPMACPSTKGDMPPSSLLDPKGSNYVKERK